MDLVSLNSNSVPHHIHLTLSSSTMGSIDPYAVKNRRKATEPHRIPSSFSTTSSSSSPNGSGNQGRSPVAHHDSTVRAKISGKRRLPSPSHSSPMDRQRSSSFHHFFTTMGVAQDIVKKEFDEVYHQDEENDVSASLSSFSRPSSSSLPSSSLPDYLSTYTVHNEPLISSEGIDVGPSRGKVVIWNERVICVVSDKEKNTDEKE